MKKDRLNSAWGSGVTALLRPTLLVALCLCCAAAVAMTVIVGVPPGLDRWAHWLALTHHHHRHPRAAVDEAGLRWMIESAFYACWAATGVLAVGLLVSWRLLFGGLRRWGTSDRY